MKYGEEIKNFGSNLRRLREAANLSLQELADDADIAKSTIHRVEKGQYAATLVIVFALAKALEISPEELFKK